VRRHFWLTVGSAGLAFVIQIALDFIPVVGLIATTLMIMVLWGGVDWLYLKLARGQPAAFGDTFAGFARAFVPLMALSVLTMVLVPIGLLLCVLPGIYLMAVWMLFPALLIMDKRMDFWPAMELSRRMVHKHFWPVIGLLAVTFLVFFAGLLLCVVGLFLTMAVSNAAIIYAYEDLFCDRAGPSHRASQ
jgi:uncharacterized membrane protein